ncbi:hypothetical protein G5I_03835 [Acromyrmex echinatior]|uniref:Uncharacterized protein n=1 Tax=Acromyrmex echinatior TaxID=103372 RepID=F4WE04_ACREC|nr:hypothetical protein G5I_03835 [Acromyrmex echinatior]
MTRLPSYPRLPLRAPSDRETYKMVEDFSTQISPLYLPMKYLTIISRHPVYYSSRHDATLWKAGSAVSNDGGSDLEVRLEALERNKLSSEIIHGVVELPNEDPRAVVAAVASSSMSLLRPVACFLFRPRVAALAI